MRKSFNAGARVALVAPLAVLGLTVVPAGAGAVTGGAVDASATFVRPVMIGDAAKGEDRQNCTGSQIARDWALTSADCLRASGAAPATTGAVPLRLMSYSGYRVLDVTLHPTRDVALLHLDNGDLGVPSAVTPVPLASAPAAAGETLRVIGAGRTGTQWLPSGPHAGTFVVQSAADTVSLTATGDASVCQGDAGGPVVRDVGGAPKLVAIISTGAPAGCLDSATAQGHTATAARVDDLGLWIKGQTAGTGFETSDPAVAPNVVGSGGVSGVVGITASVAGPELGIRTERAHTGTGALMYSGKDNSTTKSYAYLKAATVPNIPVDARSVLEYWIYPLGGTGSNATGNYSTCVAVDLDFTDGTYLRGLKATASNGVEAHPAKQCGHLTLNTWNQVRVGIGRVAAGKRIKQVNVGYDQPANIGGYRGYIDDISFIHGCVPPAGTSCALNGGTKANNDAKAAPGKASDVSFDDPAPVAEESTVENFAYPGAATILAQQKVRIISGDGRLLLADCSVPTTGPYEYIRLRTTDSSVGARGQLCLKLDNQVKFGSLSSTAMLKLELPNAYSIRSDGYEEGVGHNINAVWRVGTEPAQMAPVPQNGYLSIGIADPDVSRPATVMQILVLP
jgi:hypothetical protein